MVKNKKIIIALAVAVCLIIALYHFYLYPNWSQKDLEKIDNFLNSYQFKHSLGYIDYFINYPSNLTSSHVLKIFGKYTTQSPALLGSEKLNYSKFNHSIPLLTYVRIDLIAKNFLEVYESEFQRTLLNTFSNSTSTSFQYKGIYVFCFYNFTDEGILYFGERPNVYWCFANTMYKNVGITYGEWGFAETLNLSNFINSANETIEEFILNYSR